MRKSFLLLTMLVLSIFLLCGCGAGTQVQEVEKMIDSLGEITLDSADALEQIEAKLDALEKDELDKLKNYGEFKRARHSYEKLAEEENKRLELEEKIESVSELISAIGQVTHESDNEIRKARSAYDDLDDESKKKILNYDVLLSAEQTLPAKNAEYVMDLLNNMGEISLDSEKSIIDIEKAYKGLTDKERTLVTNADILDKAWGEYYKLYAQSIIRVTDVSISSPDSAGGVELYFNFVNNSEKTIKYLYFGVTFYNRVNDIVCCKYKNDEVNQCQLTGPYEQGQGLSGNYWHWGDFYNWDIDRVELVNLSVEYTDGTYVSFNDKMMPYVQY